MKKVLNKILLLATLIFTFMLTKYNVYAASANITITSDKNIIDIDDTLTVNVKVETSDTKLGAWIFDVSHDNKLQLVSGDERIVAVADDENVTSKEYTLTYKAVSSGNSTVSISNPKVLEWDSEESLNVNATNINITIKSLPVTRIQLDEPSGEVTRNNEMLIRGWSMSNITDKKVEIYIDDQKIENVESEEREDVLQAIKDCGSREENPKPGFRVKVDNTKLTSGNHKIIIKVINNKNSTVVGEISRDISIVKPKYFIQIDSPTYADIVTGNVLIHGWSMSNIANKEIQIYVDDQKLENVQVEEREDVLNAIKDYGSKEENPTPGFSYTFNTETLSSGQHFVKVKLINKDNNEILGENKVLINIKIFDSFIQLDSPNYSVASDKKFVIRGWSMSNLQNKKVEIYIDGKQIENIEPEEREDVLNAIKDYGGRELNPTPGFKVTVDSKNLYVGKHVILIRIINANNNQTINKQERIFEIKKLNSFIQIDGPSGEVTRNKKMLIQGWSMSNITDKKIEIYIDDQKIENTETEEREDVLNAIKGYGGRELNPTPGFKAVVDNTKLTSGKHKITVKLLDSNSNEIIGESYREINIPKYVATIQIDSPSSDELYKTNVEIRGWTMANTKNKEVQIYVDDQRVENVGPEEREDVLQAIKNYGSKEENPIPGFKVNYNCLSLKDGQHTITIKVVDSFNNEIISTSSKTFKIKKYNGLLNMDGPTGSNFSSNFDISGWEMSELDNSYIKIYMDGWQISSPILRVERQDVLDAIKDYGDASVNETPGFKTTVSIDEYNEGLHTLTVKLFTKLDDEIYTINRNIFISKSLSYGIDISEYQTVYNWGFVKSYGIDYAIIRSVYRGYGSAGRLVQDSKFYDHVRGASAAGLKLGTYVFSQAVNTQEAIDEANLSIQMVNIAGGKNVFQMPIIFDAEFSSCAGHCGRADHLSKQQRTDIVKAFCETVKNAGYTPMIYASPSFFNNQLDMGQLSSYQVWVANYGVSSPYYSGPYQIWQYTSSGSVTGINGRVDMDYIYLKY